MFLSRTQYRILLVTGCLVIATLSGAVSYRIGYREGSLAIASPPLNILNAATINEPSLILVDPGQKVDFSNFWRSWYTLEQNFAPASSSTFTASSSRTRLIGAIEGLASSYNDPYTVFIPKKQADEFKESVNGEFQGIGAVLSSDGSTVFVTGVLPHSPAEIAGLKKGTTIIAVDGVSTTGQSLETVIPRIRGPEKSMVTLSIIQEGSTSPSEMIITRAAVIIPTTATRVVTATKDVIKSIVAKAQRLLASSGAALSPLKQEAQAERQQFFVLQLVQFSKSSVDAFIDDLEKFAKSDTPYLIIDLRNNPGGILEVAVDLASYFLPKDALVVSQRNGISAGETQYRSSGHSLLEKIAARRIVVLVNKNSASASEILAGALQDHGVAKIVGEKSFGKGSVQTLIDIGDIGSIKVTIARWYTPNGNNISETGIVPNVSVDMSNPLFASSTDPFMDAATATLLDDAMWK